MGFWCIIIGSGCFGVAMVMCSVLLFMQTNERIYNSAIGRIDELETKVYNIEKSNNIKDKELRPYGQ